MTTHHDDLDQLLRPWMQRHAPDAPNELVLRIIGEIETMSEHAPTRSWLSRASCTAMHESLQLATAWQPAGASLRKAGTQQAVSTRITSQTTRCPA